MISIARTLGAPETVPAGRPASSADSASWPSASAPVDVRDDVHHVAVALDDELLVGVDRADPRHPADVVAAEVEQHQVLGALLGVGQQLGLERRVLGRGRAARPGAGDRADGDHAVLDPHQDLGAGADHLEAAEVEVEHVGRGVGAPQRAVEREGRQVEVQPPALATAPPGRCRRRGCSRGRSRPWRGRPRAWCSTPARRPARRRRGRARPPAARGRGRAPRPSPARRPGRRRRGRSRPPAAQAGLITVTSPFTPSTTTTTVGRSMIASGRPSGSGLTSGSRSTSRTMS